MKLRTLLSQSLLVALYSTSSFATGAVEFDKPIEAHVQLKSPRANLMAKSKSIALMNIKLSSAQREQFIPLENLNPSLVTSVQGLPKKFEVGMNNTPVLDQGNHGSCVTFATTAAIDALIGKGDYVSQLCSLALGLHMENNGYYPSGWDGTLGAVVINQLLQLGIIDKNTQRSNTCGGLSEYPVATPDTSNPMPLEEYHALSQNINDNIDVRPIMTVYDRFDWGPDIQNLSAALLKKVKKLLVNKFDPTDPSSASRLTFAVLIPYEYCSVGACGTYHAKFDTWVLSDTIKNDTQSKIGGHEMVITGYDDNAIVYDNQGKAHKGLLKLRNSWGTQVGDKGDYYMTYEYFRQYVLEVQQLIWLDQLQ